MIKLFPITAKSSINAYVEKHGRLGKRMPTEYVPIEMVLEHNEQCIKTYGMDAATLAMRGGLSWMRLLFVLADKDFRYPDKNHRYSELYGKQTVVQFMTEWRHNNVKTSTAL